VKTPKPPFKLPHCYRPPGLAAGQAWGCQS
jgi:hypothetical protein